MKKDFIKYSVKSIRYSEFFLSNMIWLNFIRIFLDDAKIIV